MKVGDNIPGTDTPSWIMVTKELLADAWDEGFEAGHQWSPQTAGIPHDPPWNPYR